MEEEHEIRISPVPVIEDEETENTEQKDLRKLSSSSSEEEKTSNNLPETSNLLNPSSKGLNLDKKDDGSDSSSSDKEQEKQYEPYRRRKTIEEKLLSLSEYGIDISVSNPQIKSSTFGKHIVYTISGKDSIGDFYVQRRYKEFLALKKLYFSEWPGCCISYLPPKESTVCII